MTGPEEAGGCSSTLQRPPRLRAWLPMRSHALASMQVELAYPHRLFYKVGILSYKCLHWTKLLHTWQPDSHRVGDIDGRSHLRSATDLQLVVPHTKTKTIGVRGFRVSGPTFWNYLPRQLRDIDLSLRTSKHHLKTELFRDADWKEDTAGPFVMLLTLRSVLKCLITNNDNNNNSLVEREQLLKE